MQPQINAENEAACGVLFADERGEAFKFFFFPSSPALSPLQITGGENQCICNQMEGKER